MAARRILLTKLPPATTTTAFFRSTAIRTTTTLQTRPVSHRPCPHRPSPHRLAPHQTRTHSTAPPTKSKVYDFSTIKSLTESPSPSRILIDVREPAEYTDGYIPGAINLPIKSAPEALLLPADEFEDRFGFAKPTVEQEVVFYCRSGVRSSAAAQLAEQAGYEKIAEYRGSWMDWAAQGGKVAR